MAINEPWRANNAESACIVTVQILGLYGIKLCHPLPIMPPTNLAYTHGALLNGYLSKLQKK